MQERDLTELLPKEIKQHIGSYLSKNSYFLKGILLSKAWKVALEEELQRRKDRLVYPTAFPQYPNFKIYEFKSDSHVICTIIENNLLDEMMATAFRDEKLDHGQTLLGVLNSLRIGLQPKGNDGWTIGLRVDLHKLSNQIEIDVVRKKINSVMTPYVNLVDYNLDSKKKAGVFYLNHQTEGTCFARSNRKLSPESIVISSYGKPDQEQLAKILITLEIHRFINRSLRLFILAQNAEKLGIEFKSADYCFVDENIDDMKQELMKICEEMESKPINVMWKKLNDALDSMAEFKLKNFKINTSLKKLANPDYEISSVDLLKKVKNMAEAAVKYGNYKDKLLSFVQKYEVVLSNSSGANKLK